MVKSIAIISAFTLGLIAGIEAFKFGSGNQFIKGLNQPWGDGVYGHYLGLEPAHPDWGYSYNVSETTLYLQTFKKFHAKIWRVWLFEAGQGLNIENNTVLNISDIFYSNFDDIIRQSTQYGVKVYPTLFTGQPGQGDLSILPNFITDLEAQENLINNVVMPFTQRYKRNKTIAAIQIYNELNNWCNPYFGSTVGTQAQCNAFVSAVTKAIKKVDPSRSVTVSQIQIDDYWHPANISNKDFMGTGVDAYDIHVYNDDGSLNPASIYGLDKPVLLGEFGETVGNGTANQAVVVSNFIKNARSGGWAGALYWAMGEPGQVQSNCNDATLTLSLFDCEGKPREAFYAFKSG